MTPWLDDGDLKLYHGDCLDVLAQLPERSVDCCVTSPPYWGLRDYGTARWEGGDPECDHTRQSSVSRASSGLDGSTVTQGGTIAYKETCGKCGATRVDRQLGLEQTPQEYVTRMVEVFRGVRRVLKDDGTVWLNLGDSYAASRSYQVPDSKHKAHDFGESNAQQIPPGLKPKDLVGIPWRVALALQDDGWYLRSDIIWAKPNPMPESVTDRPTKAHEYVFLLSKQPRYFFDQEAVREDSITGNGVSQGIARGKRFGGHAQATGAVSNFGDRELRNHPNGRNVRSVWEIATQPFPGAHFAVFPPDLARRCILAGSREGGTVLDPFAGSGTTLKVARDHGRHSVGIELNEEYLKIAADRLAQQSLLTGEAA